MYDKLFSALDENSISSESQTPKAGLRRDGATLQHSSSKDLGSTSGSLFGAQAIDSMQKKYVEQI